MTGLGEHSDEPHRFVEFEKCPAGLSLLALGAADGPVWRGEELRADFPKPGTATSFRSLFLLPRLATQEAASISEFTLRAQHSKAPDSVDGKPGFEVNVVEHGIYIHTQLRPLLRSLIHDKLLPYITQRFGCSNPALAAAITRRYLPGERRRHPVHFDGMAFVTAVVGLDGEYTGGFYVQPHPSKSSRQFVRLQAGDVAIHRYDLRHGVDVSGGSRYSLVLWFKPDQASAMDGSLPWYPLDSSAGDADAQHNWARLLQCEAKSGDSKSQLKLAKQLYEKAAAQGHAEAQRCLGSMLFKGLGGTTASAAEAFIWWHKAAKLGDGHAQKLIANVLRFGMGGTPADVEQADYWEKKHISQQGFGGDSDASDDGAPARKRSAELASLSDVLATKESPTAQRPYPHQDVTPACAGVPEATLDELFGPA
eukprot:TRINITY_DN13522_c0_g1_i1.p1 TRINITY_DN13522_c0_g1~~TRINITY_DN13522_c0_g1_i1.p1  ORF type:complete len:423 (+),score=61.24 TRINITY_DN13522_c0_g1_i1:207-1475(+)